MDWITLLTSAAGMITALGGFELVKWLANRESNSRIMEAKADNEEVKADDAEFNLLKAQIEFLQAQMVDKEKRFAEQTDMVRDLNRREIEYLRKIGQLEIELATKKCEVKGCLKRQPPTGY